VQFLNMTNTKKEIKMSYTFKGRLCGYICAECPEPLANLQVRLYRVDKQRNIAALAVANPKETFAILDDDQVSEKESRLLAKAEMDAEGNYAFELDKNYKGEAFEVDVYCGSVPRQKIGKRPPKPRQFTITTVQPRYRETENGFIAVWDYCLPYRFWCAVLALFDVWTICGSVLDCETKVPVAGVKVKAFDADWLADDYLGFAFTDVAGKFIITYAGADFRQGTWINIELIGGPDLYFTIEDSGGNPLLTETQADGRTPGRENADNCFCVELCINEPLKCELTDPTGCTAEESDLVGGFNFVRVKGTVSGGGFGSYTLEVLQSGSPVSDWSVQYPGGGVNGTVQVVGGELGRINTTGLIDGGYTIRLTVHSAGPGMPVICTEDLDFTLLKIIVYMNKVGKIATDPQPLDPAAELRAGGVQKAVGGSISIEGAAYVYGCVDRKIKKYDIRTKQVSAPGTEPAQPATDDPIPAGWSIMPPLPLEYTLPDQYQTWTRIGQAPRDLINSWKTFTIGATTYYALTSKQSNVPVSGRHSLLLVVEDTAGHRYYDIQHVWIDNNPVLCQIVKFQRLVSTGPEEVWADIPTCMDLLVSLGTIRIVGLAWDSIIDTAWWPPVGPQVAPNDNFSHYRLDFGKQFGPMSNSSPASSHPPILGDTVVRVPALPALVGAYAIPTVADAAVLARWDLTTLDAGSLQNPYIPPAYPKIYRGESCTYNLQLFVTDSTAVNDNGGSNHDYHQVPVKIVNDL